MAPLARERAHVSLGDRRTWPRSPAATAERRGDLEATSQRLPRFLRELRPTMARLGALADEMTPVFTDLGAVAPDINRFLLELGPFSQAGIPALDSLGERAVDRHAGDPQASLPVIQDTRTLASRSEPVGEDARRRAGVVQGATTGIERAMDFLFYRRPRSTASTRSATTCAPA